MSADQWGVMLMMWGAACSFFSTGQAMSAARACLRSELDDADRYVTQSGTVSIVAAVLIFGGFALWVIA